MIWRYADTGALIQAGTSSDSQSLPLVKLSQSDLLRLRLPVPEDAVGYIHDGDTVQIRVDALHRSFTGKIVRFTRNVSLDTRTMETEVDVPNKDLSIDPGMYANSYVQLAHKENVLTVPLLAVQHDDAGHAFVLVVDGENHVHRRAVSWAFRALCWQRCEAGCSKMSAWCWATRPATRTANGSLRCWSESRPTT